MRTGLLVFGAVLGLSFSAHAGGPAGGAEKVTQDHIGPTYQAWHPLGLRAGGTSIVSFDQPDAPGRRGSLEQVLPAPGGPALSAALEIFSEDVILLPGEGLRAFDGGFGRLADLTEASYRWWRDAGSTTAPWLASALRLIVYDPDAGTYGSTWELVYEPVYNAYPVAAGGVPTGRWVYSDATAGFVWRSPVYFDGAPAPLGYCAAHLSECYRYDRAPADWGFGPRTVVIGVQVAAGSGWPGSYRGFVDDVRLGFGAHRSFAWNFEPF